MDHRHLGLGLSSLVLLVELADLIKIMPVLLPRPMGHQVKQAAVVGVLGMPLALEVPVETGQIQLGMCCFRSIWIGLEMRCGAAVAAVAAMEPQVAVTGATGVLVLAEEEVARPRLQEWQVVVETEGLVGAVAEVRSLILQLEEAEETVA